MAKTNRARERGALLLNVLLIVAVAATLGVAATGAVQQALLLGRVRFQSLQAYYAAENGQQVAYNAIAKPGNGVPLKGMAKWNQVDFTWNAVALEGKKGSLYMVTSTGMAPPPGPTHTIVTTVELVEGAGHGQKDDKIHIISWQEQETR